MERLLVMRHAKSSWDPRAPSDFSRPLTGRGLEDAPRMGRYILDKGWSPDVIVSSPATRAAMTSLLAASAWDTGADGIRWDRRIYGGGVDDLLAAVTEARDTETVLVVGHNPTMDAIVERLADGAVPRSGSGKLMTTAAVAGFELDNGHLDEGSARLAWLTRPEDL